MSVIKGLQRWWQVRTGEEDTPFDGDSPAFIASLLTHLLGILVMGLYPLALPKEPQAIIVSAAPTLEEKEAEITIPEEFYFSSQPSEQVGANSVGGDAMAMSEAPIISEVSAIPNHLDLTEEPDSTKVEINNEIEVATGLHYNQNLAVKGAAGQGTTGAVGAIDRLTHEILLSLEERKTLVVWVFDQTASLIPQRAAIHDRFDKIYQELGIIEAAGNKAFTKHEDKPLLSAIVAFGQNHQMITKQPTDSLDELKAQVKNIVNDQSGDENVFRTVQDVAQKFAPLRYTNDGKKEPERNVMIVVFTDEAGSDQGHMDETVKLCRRYAMPVYVVGVPAPFGRREIQMKYIYPDKKFDQSERWGVVEQGPETAQPEMIRLGFSGHKGEDDPIDSGFGPYALTRLCVETGGIYFTVHPNRDTRKTVSRGETKVFSAHISRFFDPEVMRRYRPDYVSLQEYQRRISANKARFALISAAKMSVIDQMESPQTRFVKRDEGAFSNDLSEAQQAAARLEPRIAALQAELQRGEGDREKESSPRWQAGFDLAMGRVLACKVRTETYNGMLAAAKRGLKTKNPKNNTFTLTPDDEISVGSATAKMGEKAKMYLNRVIKDHPGTPWALMADRELKDKLGWKWEDSFTDLTPPRMGAGGNNNPAAAANDAKKMLERKAPPPPPIKL